jgi:hypothetical protein
MKFPKRHKYGAAKVTQGGESFRSKLEAAVEQTLRLREKAGEIRIIRREVNIFLTEARIRYIPDFLCEDLKTGEEFFVEAKGYSSDRWVVILKLYRVYGPKKLELWKGNYRKPYLDEVIIPKRGAEDV